MFYFGSKNAEGTTEEVSGQDTRQTSIPPRVGVSPEQANLAKAKAESQLKTMHSSNWIYLLIGHLH